MHKNSCLSPTKGVSFSEVNGSFYIPYPFLFILFYKFKNKILILNLSFFKLFKRHNTLTGFQF